MFLVRPVTSSGKRFRFLRLDRLPTGTTAAKIEVGHAKAEQPKPQSACVVGLDLYIRRELVLAVIETYSL